MIRPTFTAHGDFVLMNKLAHLEALGRNPQESQLIAMEVAAKLEAHDALSAALRMYMRCCGNTADIVDRQSLREAWEAGRLALDLCEGILKT